MIPNTVKELPVTLADIKRESREDEIIQSIKNKIHDKDPNVPEVFSLFDDVLLYNDRVVIPKKPSKKNPQEFSHGTSGEEPYEKHHALLFILAKHGLRDIADMIESCKGCTLAAKISNYEEQTMAKNRPYMKENTCVFCRARRQHVLPHCVGLPLKTAWGLTMQKTNYQLHYWIFTGAIRALWCSRLCGD